MPNPNNPTLSLKWHTDPDAAAAEVMRAIRMTLSLTDAATNLGIGRRTLCRWLKCKPQLKLAYDTKELSMLIRLTHNE